MFQHDVISTDGVGRSLAVDSTTDTILRARLSSTQSLDVSWELSADGGSNFEPFTPGADWTAFAAPGTDLLWRSTHTWAAPGGNPTVSDVTVEWLNEFGPIATIADVPDDQGGWVRVSLTRSGYDFADEDSLPATGYQIYHRVDAAAAAMVRKESAPADLTRDTDVGLRSFAPSAVRRLRERTFVLSEELGATAATFPPGTWEAIAWVAATQTDTYLAKVSTDVDSTGAGIAWSAYLVTTHTTTPSVWFISEVDSGYSVDNIAPGVPQSLVAAYNTGSGNQLSWDPNTELDFQYYRVYRDTDPNFVPSLSNFVEGTASTSWTDTENDGGMVYYKITAVDDADNESDPASPGTVTSVPKPVIPESFALHQNVPNPFNPTTTIRYDVARGGGKVTLQIFDVGGRLVKTLLDDHESEGQKRATWDGQNNAGQQVATGTYFYRLSAPGFTQTKKMVLLK